LGILVAQVSWTLSALHHRIVGARLGRLHRCHIRRREYLVHVDTYIQIKMITLIHDVHSLVSSSSPVGSVASRNTFRCLFAIQVLRLLGVSRLLRIVSPGVGAILVLATLLKLCYDLHRVLDCVLALTICRRLVREQVALRRSLLLVMWSYHWSCVRRDSVRRERLVRLRSRVLPNRRLSIYWTSVMWSRGLREEVVLVRGRLQVVAVLAGRDLDLDVGVGCFANRILLAGDFPHLHCVGRAFRRAVKVLRCIIHVLLCLYLRAD